MLLSSLKVDGLHPGHNVANQLSSSFSQSTHLYLRLSHNDIGGPVIDQPSIHGGLAMLIPALW